MTFAGEPRDHHVYEHAHESPQVMYVPLVVLAVFAVVVGWPAVRVWRAKLLEQARPAGTLATVDRRRVCAVAGASERALTHHEPVVHDTADDLVRLRHGAGRVSAGDGRLSPGGC